MICRASNTTFNFLKGYVCPDTRGEGSDQILSKLTKAIQNTEKAFSQNLDLSKASWEPD